MVAARALAAPVGENAAAIARQDEGYLRRLPGIGPQKAKNIVAQLQAKVPKFALAKGEAVSPEPAKVVAPDEEALRGLVFDILVKQLAYHPSGAAPITGASLVRRTCVRHVCPTAGPTRFRRISSPPPAPRSSAARTSWAS